jgi:hypothetical protein
LQALDHLWLLSPPATLIGLRRRKRRTRRRLCGTTHRPWISGREQQASGRVLVHSVVGSEVEAEASSTTVALVVVVVVHLVAVVATEASRCTFECVLENLCNQLEVLQDKKLH